MQGWKNSDKCTWEVSKAQCFLTVLLSVSLPFRFPVTTMEMSTCLSPVCYRWAVFTSGCPTYTEWPRSWASMLLLQSQASTSMVDTHMLCKTSPRKPPTGMGSLWYWGNVIRPVYNIKHGYASICWTKIFVCMCVCFRTDGYIVCEEHEEILRAAWVEEQELQKQKEQEVCVCDCVTG